MIWSAEARTGPVVVCFIGDIAGFRIAGTGDSFVQFPAGIVLQCSDPIFPIPMIPSRILFLSMLKPQIQ